jgi:hypothetical protein
MCSSGKITYTTRKTARSARRELQKIHEKKFEVYKCSECGKFHLTTKQIYGKSKEERKTVLRNVLSIERFCYLSSRIDRLDAKRRRELSGTPKAGKGNKRRGGNYRDKLYE